MTVDDTNKRDNEWVRMEKKEAGDDKKRAQTMRLASFGA
jgi:hypothetical protein